MCEGMVREGLHLVICHILVSHGVIEDIEPKRRKETTRWILWLNPYGSSTATKFVKHINSAGAVVTGHPAGRDPGAGEDPGQPDQPDVPAASTCTPRTPSIEGRAPFGFTWSPPGEEATVFTEAEKAALELTEQGTRPRMAAASRTKPGRTRPSTTTMNSSARSCASSL